MCTGVPISALQHVWELLLGSGDTVNLDSGDTNVAPSPGHHHCVLQLNGTGMAANEEQSTGFCEISQSLKIALLLLESLSSKIVKNRQFG